MKVQIETRAVLYVAGRDPVDIKTIDWKDSSDRKWLMNHMHWAMHNNRVVSIAPIESN